MTDLLLLKVIYWFEIGLYLGLEKSELATIEHDNPKDTRTCAMKMFIQWLDNDKEPSYARLMDALLKAEDQTAVEALCNMHCK